MRSTFIYTTGVPGSGKSYYRCARYLVDDYLQNTTSVHCSNFPVQYESWTDQKGVQRDGLLEIAKRRGLDPDDVRERVKVLPTEVTKEWENLTLKKGQTPAGPWDHLDDIDISGWHIAFDEIHNFCGRHAQTKVQQRWEQWLGEIRHQGATVEFLTQSPDKVARCIPSHCEMRHQLVKGETLPDFWFKIPMYDWYQLRAKFTGKWYSCCWQITQRQELGKWKTVDQVKFNFDPEYFGVYNSHSAPIAGATAGGERPMEYETMNRRRLLLWFAARNDSKLILKGALGMLPPILLIGGPFIAPALFTLLPGWLSSQMTNDAEPGPAVVSRSDETSHLVPGTYPMTQTQNVDYAPIHASRRSAQPGVLDQLDQDREGFTIGVVSRDQIVFRNGFAYQIGEKIDVGPHKGRAVTEIDFQRRLVHLDDGEILRLGAAGLSDRLPSLASPSAFGNGANVQADVPATDGRSTHR